MSALPSKASFTGSNVTQGQFKAALDTLNDYLAGLLGADGTPGTARAALGVINDAAPTFAQIVAALGYTPPPPGGSGSTGTWPINVSGNATRLATGNFSVLEADGKLIFKCGSTVIASMSSSGVLSSLGNVASNSTP